MDELRNRDIGLARETVTEDGFLGGRLRLRQLRAGHRAGHDAVLLAAATAARPGDRVVDLGAGVGAAGLALAARLGKLDLVLLDIDPRLSALAQENAERNRLPARTVTLDVNASAQAFAAAGLAPDSVDGVLTNPPFNHPRRHRASPDPIRASAHAAAAETLEAFVRAARRMLKPRGILTLIWRADGLGDVLAALQPGFGAVCVLPVYPRADSAAIRVLVRAVKGARGPLSLVPGLVLNDEAGAPSREAAAILRGDKTLTLAVP